MAAGDLCIVHFQAHELALESASSFHNGKPRFMTSVMCTSKDDIE